jgi:aryl-alcohol dehydrogenase-like predicted oxidoreductase
MGRFWRVGQVSAAPDRARETGEDTTDRQRPGRIRRGGRHRAGPDDLRPGRDPAPRAARGHGAGCHRHAGVTLFDSADAYGPGAELGLDTQGANERLIAGLLDELGVRDQVLLATKAGHVRTDDGGWAIDGRPEHLRAAVDASLERLGVEQIALWQHHRPDPDVPYAEVLGTLQEVYESGKVRMVGLSNADPDQIREAYDVLGGALVSVQNQFSPAFRSSRPEIDLCAELGLTFLPWGPLGGLGDAKALADKHPAFAEVAGPRGQRPTGRPAVGARAVPRRDPDPRREAPGVGH